MRARCAPGPPRRTRRALFETAATLLRRNLTTWCRSTVEGAPDGTLHVYGRPGQPCRRCGAPIESARLGGRARIVFRCPTCQPARPPRGATAG